MFFLQWIIIKLGDISDWFYSIYLEALYWVYPFNLVADFFYFLHKTFADLAWDFYEFDKWVEVVAAEIHKILTYDNIYSYFKTSFDAATNAWNWILDAWLNVTSIITDWWSSTSSTVQGWIAIATEGLNDLKAAWNDFWNYTWPQWTSKLDDLKAAWDNFWTITFPNLVSFSQLTTWWDSQLKEIQRLIDTSFTDRDSFWAGWQDLKDKVVEFFTDPVEFIWARFIDWFLGPEG